VSWEGHDSSLEEEDDDELTEEDSTQGVSYASGHLTKTTMETTAGTPMTEPMAMMSPLVMTVPKMTAATVAAAMMMVTSARFLQSSAIDF
jgi:hypothetical protein